MTDRELMQMADRVEVLALEMKAPNAYTPQFVMLAYKIREALRARLAQPEPEQVTFGVDALPTMEPEPVAWFVYIPSQQCGEYFDSEDDCELVDWMTNYPDAELTKLYTAPPQREWQGLTDEELLTVMQSAKDFQGRIAMTWVNHENQTYVTDVGNRIARAIEAKLKEKNT